MGTEEGLGGHNGILPKAGDNVVIPSSWWMIYDASMEGLGDVSLNFCNHLHILTNSNKR